MFLLEHQDGNVQFEFKKGGFAYKNRRLYISIETEAFGEDSFPRDFKFALFGKNMWFGLKHKKFSVMKSKRDKARDVFVYTTFHAVLVGADLEVELDENDCLSLDLELATEDVIYYDERAQPSVFGGKVLLKRKSIDEMWFPS